MRIRLCAVGRGMPGWIEQGFNEYARRLRKPWQLELREVKAAVPGKPAEQRVADEGRRLLEKAGNARIVALDETGRSHTTAALARQLETWLPDGRDLALLVGGADGLSDECRSRAETVWSLSALTLPHMLVRVLVAEQLYRAWSILNHHPYHREGTLHGK